MLKLFEHSFISCPTQNGKKTQIAKVRSGINLTDEFETNMAGKKNNFRHFYEKSNLRKALFGRFFLSGK